MTTTTSPQERFALAAEAWGAVERWSAGAQVLSLLTALHRQGWTRFLAEPRDAAELAGFAGLTPARVRELVAVLRTHGVVDEDGTAVRLSPSFAALAADDAWIGLGDVLEQAAVMNRIVRTVEPGPPTDTQALVLARAAGGRTTGVTTGLFEELLTGLPEWRTAFDRGPWLDVGCGVAGTTLTLASMVPHLRVVALELVPAVAAEARERAAALGVADRVDVRTVDARDFAAEGAFGGAFWAQPFFPEPVREATLAMIHRALRPGALLTMQEMTAGPQDPDDPRYALQRLVHTGWDVPFARPAERLAVEAEAAGFAPVRVAGTSFGRFVLVRRPAG